MTISASLPLAVNCRPVKAPAQPADAFTLIELLVVIGLIALLVGGLGVSLSHRTGGRLAAAQHTIQSLCGAARAQAAMYQTEARIVAYAEPPPTGDREKYLRLLLVYRAEPAGSETWIATGAPLYLPRGIYVLPENLDGLIAADAAWPSNPGLHSTWRVVDAPREEGGAAFAGATRALALEFNPDGSPRVEDEVEMRILVGTAREEGAGLKFDHATAIRGVSIRRSGALGVIDDPSEL